MELQVAAAGIASIEATASWSKQKLRQSLYLFKKKETSGSRLMKGAKIFFGVTAGLLAFILMVVLFSEDTTENAPAPPEPASEPVIPAPEISAVSITEIVSGTTRDLHSVVWTGSQAIAVGSGGTILTSPGGTEWTIQRPATAGAALLEDVAWTGSQAIAVGDRGTILTSPDGTTWTPHNLDAQWVRKTPGKGAHLFAAAWTGTRTIVVGKWGTILSMQ